MAHVVQDSPGPVPESPSRSSQYRYYEGFVEKKGPKDKVGLGYVMSLYSVSVYNIMKPWNVWIMHCTNVSAAMNN